MKFRWKIKNVRHVSVIWYDFLYHYFLFIFSIKQLQKYRKFSEGFWTKCILRYFVFEDFLRRWPNQDTIVQAHHFRFCLEGAASPKTDPEIKYAPQVQNFRGIFTEHPYHKNIFLPGFQQVWNKSSSFFSIMYPSPLK